MSGSSRTQGIRICDEQYGWRDVLLSILTITGLFAEQRIQRNFVKPHMALDARTPAQAAGIGIQTKNKWGALLENAPHHPE